MRKNQKTFGDHRICNSCGDMKPLSEFGSDSRNAKGKGYWCLDCKRSHTNSKYKPGCRILDDETYRLLFAVAGGKCQICGSTTGGKNRSLNVDHCHKTGFIRSLLCGRCNRGLGYFGDNPELLTKAIEYVKHYQEHPTGIAFEKKVNRNKTPK